MGKKKLKNKENIKALLGLPKRKWYIAIDNDENEVFVGIRSAVQSEVEGWLMGHSSDSDEQRRYFKENIKVFLGTEATIDIKFFPSVVIKGDD